MHKKKPLSNEQMFPNFQKNTTAVHFKGLKTYERKITTHTVFNFKVAMYMKQSD